MGNCKSSCCDEASDTGMDKNQIMIDITTKSTLYKIDGILQSKSKDTHNESNIQLLYPSVCSAFKTASNPDQNKQKQQDQIMKLPQRDNKSVNSSFFKKSYLEVISSRIRTSQMNKNINFQAQAIINPEVLSNSIDQLILKLDNDIKQEESKVVQKSQAEQEVEK